MAGIGSVLVNARPTSLGGGIGIGKEKMVLEHLKYISIQRYLVISYHVIPQYITQPKEIEGLGEGGDKRGGGS